MSAVDRVFDAPVASVGAKFVLLALAHECDAQTEAWECVVTIAELSRRTGFERRTVQRHLAWLIDGGWITRTRFHGDASTFNLACREALS